MMLTEEQYNRAQAGGSILRQESTLMPALTLALLLTMIMLYRLFYHQFTINTFLSNLIMTQS